MSSAEHRRRGGKGGREVQRLHCREDLVSEDRCHQSMEKHTTVNIQPWVEMAFRHCRAWHEPHSLSRPY